MIGFDKLRKTYFVQVKVKDPITGEWRSRRKRGFKLKREAKEYEAILIKETRGHKRMTFHEMADKWDEYNQTSVIQKQKHDCNFRIRFAEYYDSPIENITKAQLLKWRANLANTSFATKTKNDAIGFVKSVFSFASEIYGIPNTGIVLKALKKTDQEVMHEMQTWTVQEFNQFLTGVELPVYKLFFKTLFWTGMRRGECMALQKSDLLPTGHLYVHASIKHFKNGLKPTKTKQSRKIKIDEGLFAELSFMSLNTTGPFLFGGEQSLAISTIQRQFVRAIKTSGVNPIRLHDLRHSHATLLINNGVNIVAVSKRLGHASINETLKTYTHLLQESEDAMVQTISKLKENGDKMVPQQEKSPNAGVYQTVGARDGN